MPLKGQRNKAHKHGKHSSKGERKESAKGKVGHVRGTPGARKAPTLHRSGSAPGSRAIRHELSQNRQRLKREELVQARRLGRQGAPKIVGFLPVGERADQHETRRALEQECGARDHSTEPEVVRAARHHQRFMFVSGPEDYQQQLDVAKIADVLVLVLRVFDTKEAPEGAEIEPDLPDDQSQTTAQTWYSDIGLCIDDEGRELLNTLSAQGLPSICVVLQGLQTIPSAKRRKHISRLHLRYFQSIFTAEQVPKVYTTDGPEHRSVLLRNLSEMRLRTVHWRDGRPYFLARSVRWLDKADPEPGADGAPCKRLSVTGFLRGKPLAANQLVHLTGFGTYQIDYIERHRFHEPLGSPMEREYEWAWCPEALFSCETFKPDEGQESLQFCNVPDPMAGEQTWPTAEEMREAEAKERQAKQRLERGRMRKVKVPAGFSEYQAAWVTGAADLESVSEDEDMDSPTAEAASAAPSQMTKASKISLAAQTDIEDALGGAWLAQDEAMTPEQREKEIARLREASKEDRDYPDEVETPLHIPARVRFQRYRGLESFRHSEWDPNEALPLDYARIFKFQDFKRTKKVALAGAAEGDVQPGDCITVVLRAVPIAFMTCWEQRKGGPLIASGLLRHEQKYTVLHFTLQRNKEYSEPIKSKQRLVLHCGFRKVVCNPIFSEPAKGNRTRFQRFFHPEDKFVMASVYGPTMYQPTPVLAFMPVSKREKEQGIDMPLVAYGRVEPPNADMLLLKKVVLTGSVFKSHKRQSIIRFMFHNEDDVKWFQPVELYTKMGMRGKITKSIGTHGHMKAMFNGVVQQNDVVCMDLWKRVFPKWTTATYSWLAEKPQDEASDDEEEEEQGGGGDVEMQG
eukprot:TRINITY_DN4144_c0_g1_i3.p1 TRINITY_DN4144_c0_g1~~TRINITY_DN4144_c0_g1_i3.p1  ORF type:complete len:893 (+),score=296.93 TRINITY_DN4144_c0_g1_i3:117-2681(+)